jgi:hypothetical protein
MPGLRTALMPVQVLAVPLLRHWVAEHEQEQQRWRCLSYSLHSDYRGQC